VVDSYAQITYIVISALCFIPAIVFHEVAHGLAANALGDPTAKVAGRLTLNPLAHIDPFGTVLLPLLMAMMGGPVFGYAKPVPYNPRFFRDKRKGDLLVGLAGPGANLVMALVGAALTWAVWIGANSLSYEAATSGVTGAVVSFLLSYLPMFTVINLYLMFFNLLPIPPLDGSSIIAVLIPESKLGTYYAIERYAMPVFLVVAFVVPYVTGFNPFSLYLNATAGTVAGFLLP
jgi:Zn-dependent protease